MKITAIKSHILAYDLPEELGYSQQYYARRTAHIVEVSTDEGLTGWGECFGPGPVAVANKGIVEGVIAPMVIGRDPLDRDVIWHHVYNLLRDHGQKGMPLQALSGVDIALWDLCGKITGQSLCKLIGGQYRTQVPVYGYGMMLKREDTASHIARFEDEAAVIKGMGFAATKMKVGLGVAALDGLNAYWFEEPVAPEDHDGYRYLRSKLKTRISGGEAEFTRWGWRDLLDKDCLDIAQPEVCALGGVSEYLKVVAQCQARFTPVVNHVWGSAIAVATNLQLLAALEPLPGGLFPTEPLLEFDTTDNKFRDNLLIEPLDIQGQVATNNGFVQIPTAPGIGVEPDRDFMAYYCVR